MLAKVYHVLIMISALKCAENITSQDYINWAKYNG